MEKKIVLEPEQYWRFRALLGDIERAVGQIQTAQSSLNLLVEQRTATLKAVAEASVDLDKLTALDWNDERRELTLKIAE